MLLDGVLQAFSANTFGVATWVKKQTGDLIMEGGRLLGTVVSLFDNGIFRTLGAGRRGYVCCSCHNVQAGTPLENILAMIETVQTS